MDHTHTHFHTGKTTTKTDAATKADRKREQKMQAKEAENAIVCSQNNKENTGNGQDGEKEEEEEEETETSANTATFKRVKTTETDHFDNFETISTSNHEETDGCEASSQGFDVPLSGTAMSINTNSSADVFVPIGERLAALYKGTLISKEAQNGRGGSKGLRFKCANNHQFTVTFSKLSKVPSENLDLETCKDIWCVKCHNFYDRCKKKARDNGAVVTSKIFHPGFVALSCRNNHNFRISIHRNPTRVWCRECRKETKSEIKKQKEIEQERKRQEYSDHQKKLFDESKERCQIEDQQNATDQRQAVRRVLVQVDQKAKEDTQAFMLNSVTELSEVNIYTVYKIIYMPSEILLASFQTLGEGLNSCFRKMAILVHPDKNSHPLSNRAFQKLSQVYIKCQETR